jgi:hypothetical protein
MTTKPVMLLAAVKGYELRLFLEAARKLGLPVALGTDRCHMLDDPWRDGAVPLKFESPRRPPSVWPTSRAATGAGHPAAG